MFSEHETTIKAFSLVRYIAAKRSTSYLTIVTSKRVVLAMIFTWVFAAVNTAPIVIGKYII